MPPIPTLSADAQTLITALTRRQQHLSTTQIPQLRQCTGTLSEQQQLAEDVREEVAYIARQVEVLDGMVDDQKGEKARGSLRSVVQDFRSLLIDLRTQTRSAILHSKKTIDATSQSARSELFSSPTPNAPPKGKHDPNDLQSTSDALTTSLYRTLALLQSSLSQSTQTTQLLQSSTASLHSTSSQHSTLNTTIASTKIVVRALEKADWLDRMLVGAAFVFFLGVVALVLKERVLDRGVGILGWAFGWVGMVWRILAWVVRALVGGGGDWETESVKDVGKGVVDVEEAVVGAAVVVSSIVSAVLSTGSSLLLSVEGSFKPVATEIPLPPQASDDAPIPIASLSSISVQEKSHDQDHDEL